MTSILPLFLPISNNVYYFPEKETIPDTLDFFRFPIWEENAYAKSAIVHYYGAYIPAKA